MADPAIHHLPCSGETRVRLPEAWSRPADQTAQKNLTKMNICKCNRMSITGEDGPAKYKRCTEDRLHSVRSLRTLPLQAF